MENKIHSSLEKAIKDVQTTNNDSTPIISNIDGVKILNPIVFYY